MVIKFFAKIEAMDNEDCKREQSCPSEALSLGEIYKQIETVQTWKLDLKNPNKISKEFNFKNFAEALSFVNRIGEIADRINHHPDIILKWGYVKIELWTHKANGLTHMDFETAKQIDLL